jgi:excisionase family DNA binding protein
MDENRGDRLTSRQTAEFLGVNVKTLRDWADKGWIEHMRTPGARGRRWFSQDVLEAFAETMRRGAMGKLAA